MKIVSSLQCMSNQEKDLNTQMIFKTQIKLAKTMLKLVLKFFKKDLTPQKQKSVQSSDNCFLDEKCGLYLLKIV